MQLLSGLLFFFFTLTKHMQIQPFEHAWSYVQQDISYACVHYSPLWLSAVRTRCDYNLFANLSYRFIFHFINTIYMFIVNNGP